MGIAGTAVLGSVGVTGAAGATDDEETGPTLFATDEMIDVARRRINAKEDPWYTAFKKVEAHAAAGLDQDTESYFAPYQKSEYLRYFRTARSHSGFAIHMGLTYAITGDERYASKAGEILLAWARDAVEDGHDEPASANPIGQGLVVGRAMTKFCYAYTLVWDTLDEPDRELIEDWMRLMVPLVKGEIFRWHENDYFGKQYYNNHMGGCTMGLASIGFTLDDQRLIRFALNSPDNPRNFDELLEGAVLVEGDDPWVHDPSVSDRHLEGDYPMPQSGEIFDRYRIISGHGLNYSMLHLRFLTLVAEAALNNDQGRNRFTNTLDLDERLERAYEFYADFFITQDPTIKGGYYARDGSVPPGPKILYEIAHRRYPNNEKFKQVLATGCSRVQRDIETFGWSLPLTHGLPDVEQGGSTATDPDAKRAWEFNTDGDLEGWETRTEDSSGTVSDGAFHLDVVGPDPAIMSPDNLRIDGDAYDTLQVRMRNGTGESTHADVFFTTYKHCQFSGGRRVSFGVDGGAEYVEYSIDLGQHADWTGAIKQLRLDYVSGPTGTVDIDYVRLTES